MADSIGGNDKGFSGLSSMVSSVETLEFDESPNQPVEVAQIPGNEEKSEHRVTSPIRTTKQGHNLSEIIEWIVSNRGAVFWLLVFGLIIWALAMPDNSVPTSSTPAANTNSPAPSPASSNITFEKPPIGTTSFNVAQIRWALREQIRLETMRNIVTTDSAIAAFNLKIDDYNSRARKFQYYQNDMDIAKRDVEKMRSQIVSEATAEARQLNWK